MPAAGAVDAYGILGGMAGSIREQKALLRARMRQVRDLVDDRLLRSVELWSQLADVPEFAAAGTVMAFWGMDSEPDTDPLFARLAAAGQQLVLPRVDGRDMLVCSAEGPIAVSRFGVREPQGPALDLSVVDFVVVPGLAFTPQGDRLAHHGLHAAGDGGIEPRGGHRDMGGGVGVAGGEGGVQPLTAGVQQQQPDAGVGGQRPVERLEVSQVLRACGRGALQFLGEVAAVVVVLAGREGAAGGHAGMVADAWVALVKQVALGGAEPLPEVMERPWILGQGGGRSGEQWRRHRRTHRTIGEQSGGQLDVDRIGLFHKRIQPGLQRGHRRTPHRDASPSGKGGNHTIGRRVDLTAVQRNINLQPPKI